MEQRIIYVGLDVHKDSVVAAVRIAAAGAATTDVRTFDTTTEDTLRVSADATGLSWLTLRAVYERAKRVGSGLDEQALDDIGEQVSLRQFDISDRAAAAFSFRPGQFNMVYLPGIGEVPATGIPLAQPGVGDIVAAPVLGADTAAILRELRGE